MRRVVESIPVKGEAAREVVLHFTRHGPVLHVDAARHRAYALRSVWQQPGTAAYLASLNYLKARELGGVHGGAGGLGRALDQPRRRRCGGQYRLGRRRHGADPGRLGRAAAGPRRRAARMGRADALLAACRAMPTRPAAGSGRANADEPAAGLRLPEGRGRPASNGPMAPAMPGCPRRWPGDHRWSVAEDAGVADRLRLHPGPGGSARC